ncbi:protocadherin-8-like [Seriola lalandi dorsalis]|uniref:protocadherin-8-like n=1 Tax=Seriola lalandi dorsalis TaxID=1841481 RepID=UPI000C6F6496|nr:protocadherin-8-like [Seriola lalandi dorsalis]
MRLPAEGKITTKMMRGKKFIIYCYRWIFICSIHQFLFASVAQSEGNTIRYQTSEEDAPGTVIGNLAKDMSLSLSHSSKSNFRMMKQFNDSFIRVRESDGELTVGERIDRERICRHTPQCLITFDVVNFSKDRYKLIHVEVEVKDINDNSPEFPNKESVVDISENAAAGSRIPLDPAVDADVGSNYIQSYQISVNSHFTIDVLLRADGVKYAELVLMKELDRETQSSYTVELVATDGGNPYRSGSTKITIKVTDFNDNSPVFDQNSFSVSLPEDAPVGTVILDLNAVDADEGSNGEVVYGFGKQVSHEIRELFQVDNKSGRLTLRSPVDFEDKSTYELDVQATDLGPNPTPSVCKIIIHITDVNDNAPEISITPMTSITTGIAYISEAADKDSLVALISTLDRDSGVNSQVHCTLYGHDHFKLRQAYEDSYMIVTAAALDRERISEYNLTVMAEDFGSPPLRKITQYTIRLSDENDNAPHFTKAVYEVSVVENNAPGAYITTVEASDADLGNNGKITYRLVDSVIMGSPVNTFVSLNSVSGSILIANHKGKVFDAHPFPEKPPLAGSNTAEPGCEDGRQTAGIFESNSRVMEGKLKGYSTLPGYGKETVRPITIWKGNSFTTISARDPHISGKDSGKGDSDFNDSDSDISGDVHKKESPPMNSLWACTSECKVLGHSDRCWSPSATRPNTSMACGPHLSTFSKTASLPRDSRRENYYPAHIAKTNGLQSVYEQVQHQELDYILVGPPTPARIQETDEISIPEYTNS